MKDEILKTLTEFFPVEKIFDNAEETIYVTEANPTMEELRRLSKQLKEIQRDDGKDFCFGFRHVANGLHLRFLFFAG